MMMIRWPTAWAFSRSSWAADAVATVLDGKFARAGIAPVEAVVMTARRTSCGVTSKTPGVAVPGRVTTVSLLAGIAAVGSDALNLSGTGLMRLCRKHFVPDD